MYMSSTLRQDVIQGMFYTHKRTVGNRVISVQSLGSLSPYDIYPTSLSAVGKVLLHG